MQRYQVKNELGQGAFGTVFRAVKISDGKVVAMKRMKRTFISWDEGVLLREVQCLMKLMKRRQHPNIVEIYEVIRENDDSLYLVFECMPENLLEFMQRALHHRKMDPNFSIGETKIKSLVRQVLEGLAHLHSQGFVHRDVKPENILIRGNLCKVADFGLAREFSDSLIPCTDYVTTRWYRAPEVCLRSAKHEPPVDIWAVGCVMAELYNLYPLFPGDNEIHQINLITKVVGTPNDQTWPEGLKLAAQIPFSFSCQTPIPISSKIPTASLDAVGFLQCLLRLNPKLRMPAETAVNHVYLAKSCESQIRGASSKQRVVSVSPRAFESNDRVPHLDSRDFYFFPG